MERNASDFATVVLLGVGTSVYWGVARRGMGGGTKRGAGIN